jgi:RHS repeat-associated protein
MLINSSLRGKRNFQETVYTDFGGRRYDNLVPRFISVDALAEKTFNISTYAYVNNNPINMTNKDGRYAVSDHLGNLRVSFKDSAGIATPLQSLFYDPWGLSMKGMQINKNSTNFNKHQYNGKELQLETGWNDFGARMYGAAEGRWWTIDPLAEEYFGISPYVYVLNRPTVAIDPDGRRVYFIGGAGNDSDGWNYIKRWGQVFNNAGIDFYRVNASHGKIGDMSFTNFYRASGMEADYTFKSVPAGGGLYAEYNGEVPVDNKMINSTAKLYKQQLKDNPLEEGEQFNLAGYSYGSVLQAQTALKLANDGQIIDNLVLIGSPISDKSDLWKQLNSNKNIKNVIRYDLKGDLLSNPQDILDFIGGAAQNRNDAGPHFDAARPGQQANQLIQTIVQWLQQQGVKN